MSLADDLIVIANELELAHWHAAAVKVRAAADLLREQDTPKPCEHEWVSYRMNNAASPLDPPQLSESVQCRNCGLPRR